MKISHVIVGALGVCVGIALVGWATWAFASGGIIHACVNSQSGEIKIVTKPDACKKNEIHLTWNREGPTGPPGPEGPAGPPGSPGDFYVRSLSVSGDGGAGTMCKPDDHAVSGGWSHSGKAESLLIYVNSPIVQDGIPIGWTVSLTSQPADIEWEVYAVCADLTP